MTTRLRYVLGALLARLAPETTERVRRSFTLPYAGSDLPNPRIARLIRAYLAEHARRDSEQLEALHRQFWSQQGPDQWYRKTAERFSTQAIPMMSDVVARCAPELEARKIRRVCEFGVGDGQGLEFLSKHWRGPSEFVGVDIAQEQIARNRERYPNLRFECADLTDWVQSHAGPNSIYVTLFGVLEYLSQDSIAALLRTMAARSASSLALFIEPLSPEFDLARDRDSQVLGREFSYSHNYPRLLKDAGFDLLIQEERPWPHYRMLVVLAATRNHSP